MTELLIFVGVGGLLIFLLCCLIMIGNFIYMEWKECSHALAIFYVILMIITALSYWCLCLKVRDILQEIVQ